MTQTWEPGTWYERDAIVEHEGRKYKAIQPHNSQSDLAPSAATASWECVDLTGEVVNDGPSLDANALRAGFSGSRWDRDEEKQPAWSREDWLRESEQRTRDYKAGRVTGPVSWILVEGRDIPEGAIRGGEERDGSYTYICRAWYEGSLQVGKAGWSCSMGAIIGYGNKERHLDKYEVLVGDMTAVHWVQCRGRVNVATLGNRPIEGGREANSTPLFIARASYNYVIVPGKCSEMLPGAFIPYGDEEKQCMDFSILCYAR